MTDEPERLPPPQNGHKPISTVADLVQVQDFLAGLIRDTEHRLREALAEYVASHEREHHQHLADTRPYMDFIDHERQVDEDWDARKRPIMAGLYWLGRNWKAVLVIASTVLVMTHLVDTDFHLPFLS